MRQKIEKALEEVRAMLKHDGGDITLVDVDEKKGIVTVSLKGACGCCPAAAFTIKSVVETTIKTSVPEVKEVKSV